MSLLRVECRELSVSCVCALLTGVVLLRVCSVEACNPSKYSFHSLAVESGELKGTCVKMHHLYSHFTFFATAYMVNRLRQNE